MSIRRSSLALTRLKLVSGQLVRHEKKTDKQPITEAEEQKLLADAQRPFDLFVQCPCQRIAFDLKTRGFAWRKKLVDERVVWQLISPIPFEVISRRTFDEEQRLDAGRGATNSDSTTGPANTITPSSTV